MVIPINYLLQYSQLIIYYGTPNVYSLFTSLYVSLLTTHVNLFVIINFPIRYPNDDDWHLIQDKIVA